MIFDVAVVLGALPSPDGRPSPAMARRVAAGVALVAQGRAANLLLTGGPVRHPVPEALIMRELALAAGVDADRLLVEPSARNTIENAALSAPLLAERGWSRVAVVTCAFHLPRALYVFRRLGMPAEGVAAWPERVSAGWLAAWAREAAALPWTVARVERLRSRT